MASDLGILEDIIILGGIKYDQIPDFYHSGDVLINLSNTGSLDKVVLESMASGLPVITSNVAYSQIIKEPFFVSDSPEEIAHAILHVGISTISENREFVVKNHSLRNLSNRIADFV